jgi:hypothetical protein
MQHRLYLREVVEPFAFPRKRCCNLIHKCQEIAVNLEQSIAVTLTKAHRRRSQEFEHRASLTKLQARDGAFVCYGELVAVPEPYQEARITDPLHDPADYGMIKFAPNETLAGINTHTGYLSGEASAKYWQSFLMPTIAVCRKLNKTA